MEPGDNFMEPGFALPQLVCSLVSQLGASAYPRSFSMHKEMHLCARLGSVFMCPCVWKDREYTHTRGCGRWGEYTHVGMGGTN